MECLDAGHAASQETCPGIVHGNKWQATQFLGDRIERHQYSIAQLTALHVNKQAICRYDHGYRSYEPGKKIFREV